MKGRILIINPGSTSTKIGFYEDGQQKFETNLTHSAEEIAKYDSRLDKLLSLEGLSFQYIGFFYNYDYYRGPSWFDRLQPILGNPIVTIILVVAISYLLSLQAAAVLQPYLLSDTGCLFSDM